MLWYVRRYCGGCMLLAYVLVPTTLLWWPSEACPCARPCIPTVDGFWWPAHVSARSCISTVVASVAWPCARLCVPTLVAVSGLFMSLCMRHCCGSHARSAMCSPRTTLRGWSSVVCPCKRSFVRPHCGFVCSLPMCSSVSPHCGGRLWPVHELVRTALLW